MTEIKINTSNSYSVYIGNGILKNADKLILSVLNCNIAVIVSDDTVFGLYAKTLTSSLENSNIKVINYVFPHGEASKNIENYTHLLHFLYENKIAKSDMLIALGGGVVGDITGFAAATYQRGIPYVQIPTTLLSAVDSSVGGKTAINLKNAKNYVGAFYSPKLVICDVNTLKTLPNDQYINGCGEIIKYAAIKDKHLFEKIEKTQINENFEEIIAKSIKIKRDIIEKDEFDKGERLLLNFGHTFGHALEVISDYTLPHGNGVALGMTAIALSCENLYVCEKGTFNKLTSLLKKYNLPTKINYTREQILSIAKTDKKVSGGTVNLVVIKKIGCCEIIKIPLNELDDYLPNEADYGKDN